MVSEENVMSQGGAFMLFYEALEPSVSRFLDMAETVSSLATTAEDEEEDMSTTSGVTEGATSVTSQATSVSTPEKVESPEHDPPVLNI